MKFKTALFLILVIALFISCNKDESSSGATYIKATVDGVAFSSTFNQVIFSNSFGPPYKLFDFTGIDDNDNTIRVTVSSYLEPGTYNLPDENHPLLGFEFQPIGGIDIWVASGNHENTTGVLTITEENNSQIKGTFSFDAIHASTNSTKQITNGQFVLNK